MMEWPRVSALTNSEWPMVELGEVCQIINGSTPSRREERFWEEAHIPWFTIEDIRKLGRRITATRQHVSQAALDETSLRLLPKKAVLLCCAASVGEYAIAEIPLTTNQQFNGLVIKKPYSTILIPEFLLFLASQLKSELIRLSGKTSFNFVSGRILKKIQIPLPPLSEQRRIVEILNQAERLRRLRTEADAKAERILPALFIKMFGDPVTNPMGWPKRSISELATVITGNTPSRKRQDYFGDYIEWVKSDNLNTPSHYITPTSEYLSEEGAKVGRKALPGSALVTCIAGSPSAIGNVALADREVAFNQQINAAVPRKGVDCYYLYGHFVVGKRLVQAASTGGMKGIVTKNRFCEIEFLAPPSDLQERFGYRCKQICEQTEARLKQVGRFDRLFSLLLHRAFTGDLTASWREGQNLSG